METGKVKPKLIRSRRSQLQRRLDDMLNDARNNPAANGNNYIGEDEWRK